MAGAAADTGPVILTETTDRIGIITLNRPERRNALNDELIAALDGAVRRMAEDPEAKVVILTGAAAEGASGGFCAGGDIKDGIHPPAGTDAGVPRAGTDASAPRAAPEADLPRHDQHAAMLLHTMAKPTIAMVGGPAVGAGCSLAAACDLRFASDQAVFAAGFSPNGLSGDYGGSLFWTRIVGTARARQLYLLNERIPAERALEFGMVHAVIPGPELREYTLDVARGLVRTPAGLLALVKDNLNAAEDDADRRRFLFAHEAGNQEHAVRQMIQRMRQRAARPRHPEA